MSPSTLGHPSTLGQDDFLCTISDSSCSKPQITGFLNSDCKQGFDFSKEDESFTLSQFSGLKDNKQGSSTVQDNDKYFRKNLGRYLNSGGGTGGVEQSADNSARGSRQDFGSFLHKTNSPSFYGGSFRQSNVTAITGI